MPQTIADGLQGIINAKSDIDGAVKAKGGIVTKGLVNSDDDIMTIKNAVTSIDITENGTYYIGEETVVTSSTFPVDIDDSNGTPLRHVDINGNTVQDGTPTQSNPVEVNGVGVRTENLFPATTNWYRNNNSDPSRTEDIQDTRIKSDIVPISGDGETISVATFNMPDISGLALLALRFFDSAKTEISSGLPPIAIPVGAKYISLLYGNATGGITDATKSQMQSAQIMVVYGNSIPTSYEPYGYKIPISSGQQTTNIDLGSTQTVRAIKKVVFDGTEDGWGKNTGLTNSNAYAISLPNWVGNRKIGYCTHYENVTSAEATEGAYFGNSLNILTAISDGLDNGTKFKNWLAEQYANGTPLTIWYVLATPETAAVNEPLMKIGDYADSLSVDVELPLSQNTKNIIDVNTTLKPSSASFTYDKISEYIGYNEINVDVSNTYTAEDEGKVVSDGNLIAQTAMPDEITENSTIDTTFYNSVTVNVPTGGGTSNDVTFYDYDGSIVKSYSAAEFADVAALPDNPTHTGLTAQGWNWSLVNAKSYVATYGKLNIGQMYITSDGKTRIYINLPEGRISPVLMLYLNANTELDIDWGDNSTHSTWTTTSAAYKSERHAYPDKGKYVIAITVVSGSFILQSQSTSYNTFFTDGKNSTTSSDRAYLNSIQKIEIGTGITTIGSYAFSRCYSLSSVTIPNTVTTIGSSAFYGCYSLSSITIPDGVTSIGNNAFQYCYSLSSVTIPNSVTTIADYAFSDCYSLSSITIPNSVTTIADYAFSNCYSLSSITIPNTVTSIGSSAFYNCYSLSSITIPNTVTSIGSNAFYNCYSLSSITIPNTVTTIGTYAFNSCNSMDYIRFIRTTPPTVSSSNAWTSVSTSTIIYVPAESINAYKTATNYPNPSSYKYVGYATYASGDPLPTSIPGYSLTWYATIEDWNAGTNPITVGNGNEVYAKTAVVSSITRETDFVNNVTTRSTDAIEALNVYRNMKRCNVADDGTINAYDGDLTYTEDGSNGQVMVKVNKFYYKLDVSQTGDLDGVNIRKGRWNIADTKVDNSYKLHPAFLAADGVTELDYFLYGAFDAVGQDSNGTYSTSYNSTSYKLGSVGGNLYAPSNSFTRATARTMATNRGTGWYQAGVKQTMAIQMLFAVEYGFNSQLTVGNGVVGASGASKTGITTGSTTSGTKDNQTTPVNWRGIENFWGNIWNWIDGLNLNNRVPYVCNTFNFVDNTSTDYTQIAFSVPSSNAYVSALGYDSNNDWIMLPSEASGANANSAIGDYVWTNTGWTVAGLGGYWGNGSGAGSFSWGLDSSSSNSNAHVGSRIMFIP